jgi:Fur family transcriptional regulator, ferric uptake regulator
VIRSARARASTRMSIPVLCPVVPAPDSAAAVQAIRDRGLRVTASRRLVIEALYGAGRPVTAEEIATGMYGRLPACDLASVYRNLETLEAEGLVRHMHLGHGPGLYAPAADRDEYATCERCGRSEVIPPDALPAIHAAVRTAVGYAASFAHSPLTGLCPACEAKLAGA